MAWQVVMTIGGLSVKEAAVWVAERLEEEWVEPGNGVLVEIRKLLAWPTSRACTDLPGRRRARHERCKGRCNTGNGRQECQCDCHVGGLLAEEVRAGDVCDRWAAEGGTK